MNGTPLLPSGSNQHKKEAKKKANPGTSNYTTIRKHCFMTSYFWVCLPSLYVTGTRFTSLH